MNTRSSVPVLLLAAALAAGAQEETTPKQRAKEQLAVRAAAGRVLESLRAASATQGVDVVRITDALCRRMQESPADFRQAGEAKDRARPLAREQRLAGFGADLTNAVRTAQEQSPLPIRSDEVLRALGPEWEALAAAAADAFVAQHYERLFADARAHAVAAQQRAAEQATRYPEAAAVDAKWSEQVRDDGQPAADAVAKLGGWLAAQMAGGDLVLFEEVERARQDAGRQAASEVALQYVRQLDAATRAALPADARAADQIEPVLRAAAEQAVAAAQRDASAAGRTAPVYPLFAAASRQLGREARRIEQERFAAYLGQAQLPALTEAEAAREIEREPARHRAARESAERLADTTMASARDRLAAAYGGAPRAAHFADLLRGDGAAAQAYRTAVRAQVEAVLPAARARVAQRQLAPFADHLAPSRAASDAAAARWFDQGAREVRKADEAMARLKEEGVAAEPPTWIEEAATQLVAQVGARVRTACDALGGQLQLVRDLEKENAMALQRDVAASRPVEQIIRAWRDELAARWKRAAPAETPYPRLLARAEDQLNKTVRQLYDARKLELAQAAAVPASESQPKEPVPPQTVAAERGTSPPEADRDEDRDKKGGMADELQLASADVVLNLGDRSAREGKGQLKNGDAEVAAFAYDPAAAQAAADAIFGAVKEPLTQVMNARAAGWSRDAGGFHLFRRATPPELKIYVIVEGNEIRHRTSLLLRKRVKALMDEWSAANRKGQEPVALRWTVGLGQFEEE